MASSLVSMSFLKACALMPTTPVVSSPSEILVQKFGRKGIKFSQSGDIPTVELSVRNGSSLKLHIPNGHIVSYMPKVYWKDDGYEEVLHTDVATSRGGIGLVVDEVPEPNPKAPNSKASTKPSSFASSEWTVKDVDSDSIDALQVELSCVRGNLDITYVVSLYPLSVATAVVVKNNGRKAVSLSSAILSHFKFGKRSGAGVQGLRGCSYCTHPPPSSPFQLLSPSEAIKTEEPGLFSFGWEPEQKPGVWTAQDVPITVLKNKLTRLYGASPDERSKQFHRTVPSKYEIIDQGRELMFRVIRMGFEEIYLSSPGSYSDKFGKEYFICTGPASVLVPVTLNPGEEWRGAQVVEHDNL